LLSFAYTLLLKDVTTACELAGLDPSLGCFHAIDYGRPSMALDLMEEFRPIIADSIVLFAVNRPVVRLEDFEEVQFKKKSDQAIGIGYPTDTDKRAVYLTGDARNLFLTAYENRVSELIHYPSLGEQTTYRHIFQLQAYHIARVILGEDEQYTPFVVR
jgi:CRISP-associated protein Cas1